MLLSCKALQRILGALCLFDGLLQMQPQMFTMNMVNSVMRPLLEGQPGFLVPSLHSIVTQITRHLTVVTLLIAGVQIGLGLGVLLLWDRWVEELVIASCVWTLIVWFGEETRVYQRKDEIDVQAKFFGPHTSGSLRTPLGAAGSMHHQECLGDERPTGAYGSQ